MYPVEAIYYENDLPSDLKPYQDDNARSFAETLPGRGLPLGSPGGARRAGVVGADTDLVALYPRRETVA